MEIQKLNGVLEQGKPAASLSPGHLAHFVQGLIGYITLVSALVCILLLVLMCLDRD